MNTVLNIMGGEFTVLNNYPELLVALAKNRNHIRLVTNGSWGDTETTKFLNTIKQMKAASSGRRIEVAVSQDSWHQKQPHNAIKILKRHKESIKFVKTRDLITDNDDIEPIGRAWDNGIVSDDVTHCACEIMCNMIVTEDGMLGRCPFGYFP